MKPGNVVPETSGVTEDEFHGAMVSGLGRAERKVTRAGLAYVMGLSSLKQLANIFAGSTPHPKRLWDARAACPTALDDVADLYGCRIVPKDALTSAELGTLPIATLLAKVAEAESPESPGGTSKTHRELLDMEDDIRAVHALTAAWIEQINDIRRPGTLRAVGKD